MTWLLSHRFDPQAAALADRHYSRRKVGSPQFVPPGRCIVLLTACRRAVFAVSWQTYQRHAWPGAWINCLFRSEGAGVASDLIRAAVAIVRGMWEAPPPRPCQLRRPRLRSGDDPARTEDPRLLLPESWLPPCRLYPGRSLGVANAAR